MTEHFKPDIQYIDESLKKDAPEKYILSIQFALDGFSFLLLDAERKKFVGLESYKFQNMENNIRFCKMFDEFVNSNSWIQGAFKDVFVIYESPKSTLIPEPLYDETEKVLLLNFNHQVSSYEQVVSNRLRNVEAYQIFAVPDCLKYRTDKVFRNKTILHHSTPLIESLLISYKNKSVENKVFLNIRSNHMDIVILKPDGLRLFNSYYCPQPEDMIYYLLFVLEQMSFNPEEVDLVLLGNIKKYSKDFELLYSYVRNVSFDSRTSAFAYSYVFDNIPDHFFYTLFNVNISQV